MGHARITNISKVFNKMIRRPDGVTVAEVADELVRTKQKVHASEGDYEERYMLAMICEYLVRIFLDQNLIFYKSLSPKQKKVFDQFIEGDMFDWNCEETDPNAEYTIFDSIRFVTNRERLPVIDSHSN